MEFKINEKDVELRFGIGFVKKLDEIYTVEMNGIPFGAGLMLVNVGLEQDNPTALANAILCAAVGKGITERQVDIALEDYADENDGFGTLFEDIKEQLGKSSVTKQTLTNMKENAEKHQEETEEVE